MNQQESTLPLKVVNKIKGILQDSETSETTEIFIHKDLIFNLKFFPRPEKVPSFLLIMEAFQTVLVVPTPNFLREIELAFPGYEVKSLGRRNDKRLVFTKKL